MLTRFSTVGQKDDGSARPNISRSASTADLEAFLNQFGEGVIVADADGAITFVNEAAETLHGQALLGVSPDDYAQSYHLFTMDGEPFPNDRLPLARAVRDEEVVVDSRWRIRRADGSEILAIGNARPIYDSDGVKIAAVLTIRDDTRRHADEVAMQDLLRTKDMLLHEVNHRVKNSLQLVTSLLSLQATRSDEPAIREGLEDASKRISVVARIHQRLYASSEHDRVNIGELLRDLAQDNIAALGPDGHVRLIAECEDVTIGLDQAVPLALCVTELVTNAIKYAFADSQTGTLTLRARLVDAGRFEIVVADDGCGLPDGFDPKRSSGLGMRIVSALTGQLRATLTVSSDDSGAIFTIAFEPRLRN